jgi:hypothetical protein
MQYPEEAGEQEILLRFGQSAGPSQNFAERSRMEELFDPRRYLRRAAFRPSEANATSYILQMRICGTVRTERKELRLAQQVRVRAEVISYDSSVCNPSFEGDGAAARKRIVDDVIGLREPRD